MSDLRRQPSTSSIVNSGVGEDRRRVNRRGFLGLAGLAGGAAVTAASFGPSGAAEASRSGEGGKATGYRETEHVRAYYASTRF